MDKSTILESVKQLEEKYPNVEKSKIAHIIMFIVGIMIMVVNGAIFMVGYNWIVPSITNLGTINLAQALLLDAVISFVVKPKLPRYDLVDTSVIYNLVHYSMIAFYDLLAFILMFIFKICI